eukprot:TRINITY_DN68958_c0_g1_i1.p1 TRINITY_DN68958_c0_g1~~TRINITY_DN68958_c0_g1_i1.p1  ORF type:complete len:451 (-),score=43.53 TRINITY_DN68958_c0_g1_i1:407-1708(-)
MCQGAIGIHWVVVSCFGAFTSLYVATCSEVTLIVAVLVLYMFTFAVVIAIVIQYNSSSMYLQLNTQLKTSRRLLDIATDGFCSVDTSTLTITSASSKFLRTFGDEHIIGASLKDYVAKRDSDQLSRQINAGTSKDIIESSPFMATCYRKRLDDVADSPECVFDARFVCFASGRNHVEVFVNIIGECRSTDVQVKDVQTYDRDSTRPEASLVATDELEMLVSASQAALDVDGLRRRCHGSANGSSLLISESSVFDLGSSNNINAPLMCEEPMSKRSISTQTIALGAKPPRPRAKPSLGVKATRKVNLRTKRLLLPEFLETPDHTAAQVIYEAASRINPRGKGCCAFHVQLEYFLKRTSEMLPLECKKGPEVEPPWQCPECLVLNFTKQTERLLCTFCNTSFAECSEEEEHELRSDDELLSSCDAASSSNADPCQ